MRKFVGFGVIVCLPLVASTSIARAALSPAAQRQVELKAIIDSPEVQAKLEGRPISTIYGLGPEDSYNVFAGPCWVAVRVVDEPAAGASTRPGPRRFRIETGEHRCTRPGGRF
jgi:hypothetical protein